MRDAYFPLRGVLNRHTESVHKGTKSFKCNHCDVGFFRKLICHNESVHEGRKPFKCNYCDESFYSKERSE